MGKPQSALALLATLTLGLASIGSGAAHAVQNTATPSPAPSTATGTPTALPSVPTIDTPQGDSIRAREYWITQYKFNEAWKTATGQGVTVAVIDTGVDGTHQDLTGNVLEGVDVSGSGSANGWKGLGLEPEHGTLVASVLAGHGHKASGVSANANEPGNPAGVIGVAPDAKILPISLEIGSSSATTKSIDEQIPAAVKTAVDRGADIINLSVGSNDTSWPQSWDAAFEYAEEKGVIIVASAGNRGAGVTQVGAPSTIPGVLSVGGVDRNKNDSWSSSSQGISIAVVAPSEEMVGAYPGNKYAVWDGTSASAPLVAGLAALIKEKYPDLTGNQIIQRIIESATDAGASGKDPIYGYGIIDPLKALDPNTPDDAQSNPLGSMKEWVSVHRKNTANATPSASATPMHQQDEKLQDVAAPQAASIAEESGILPFIVMAGFALWVGIITVGSIVRLHRVGNRRSHKS